MGTREVTVRSRRTIARHASAPPTPRALGTVLKIVGVALAVVLVSGAGVAAYTAYDLTAEFASDAVDLPGQEQVPPDIGAIETGVDLYIAGTDECEPEYASIFGDRCTGADADGQLNDVNMLVHISHSPRRVTVVSFPRDLMIAIPSCPREDGSESPAVSKMQLNSAWSRGGLPCALKTISKLSGLTIPYAAKVSFGNVINITGAIGGVDVCIGNGGIRDEHTGIDWPAGPKNVQGVEALQFLRTRYGLKNGSDLARIANQQQYMSNLARKLVSDEVLSDVPTLLRLATTAVRNVTPSRTLANPLTLVQIALAVKNVPFDEIVFVQYPVYPDPDDEDKVVPNEAAAAQLWAALAANQPIVPTNDANLGGGVIVQEPPVESPAPEASPAPGSSDAPATPSPTESAVELPESIPGMTAADQVCSAGNVRAP